MQEQTITALRTALTAQQLPFAQGEPLAPHTTFKIGGPAAFWCTPRDAEQLRRTLQLCRENGVRVYLLGNGSNTLFDDAGFDGAVIDMRGLSGMENSGLDTDAVRITAGAGQTLGRLCSKAQTLGLTGLEFACGIPGTVGGAVYMNAGAYGSELKDVLESCGVSEDKRMQFGAQFDESFGGGAVLNPRNLIDVKKCVVKTPDVSITVNPERPDLIETRTLGGVRYILIKADEGVELNGIDLAEEAE